MLWVVELGRMDGWCGARLARTRLHAHDLAHNEHRVEPGRVKRHGAAGAHTHRAQGCAVHDRSTRAEFKVQLG